MKLTDLKHKELGELQKELTDTKKELNRASLEVKIRREKNLRRAFELKRKVATLHGLISTKETK
jgi:ribosomal protein L29